MYRLFLLIGVTLAAILSFYLKAPWFTPALVAVALAGFLPVWRRGGFWFAFLAGFFSWGIHAGLLHWENQGLLSDRLAATFGLASGWLLVLTTAGIGGLTTGLGGWFGASLRLSFREKAGKAAA